MVYKEGVTLSPEGKMKALLVVILLSIGFNAHASIDCYGKDTYGEYQLEESHNGFIVKSKSNAGRSLTTYLDVTEVVSGKSETVYTGKATTNTNIDALAIEEFELVKFYQGATLQFKYEGENRGEKIHFNCVE